MHRLAVAAVFVLVFVTVTPSGLRAQVRTAGPQACTPAPKSFWCRCSLACHRRWRESPVYLILGWELRGFLFLTHSYIGI